MVYIGGECGQYDYDSFKTALHLCSFLWIDLQPHTSPCLAVVQRNT